MGAAAPAGALAIAGVQPHKSKGQNFLVQPRVADRIVAAAAIAPGDAVLEIGPGLGMLTERIAALPVSRIVLVELDERLAARLAARYADDRRVTIVNRDFLAIDAHELGGTAPYRVVANLPFNAAAAILERLCAMHPRISRMVLMFQREVGERIRAATGTSAYGALSAYTAIYWKIAGHFRVAAGSFHPRPKVDAEVLSFAPRDPLPFHSLAGEQALLTTIRAAFCAPRKTLRNALATALALDGPALEAALARAAIDPAARAATLALGDLIRLAHALPQPLTLNHRDA
ncbi:MAG: ribosomal RNA small subunit methyltransferase A [Candidatus Binataceae bacterium]|nr:ribosomal RNA small subunit methyltransferase A [Candidatus Binataceae bacterium]